MGAGNRLAQLREAKKLKAEGKSRLSTYQLEESEAIYDEVDEAGFKQVVQKRLMDEDFVVDDNGLGYADNGTYDWDHTGENDDSEVEDDGPKRKKKNPKDGKHEVSKSQKNSMEKFMSKSSILPKKPAPRVTAEDDQNFMDGLLGEVEMASTRKPTQNASSRLGNFTSFSRSLAKRHASPPLRNRPANVASLFGSRPDAAAVVPSLPDDYENTVDVEMEETDHTTNLPSSPSDVKPKSKRFIKLEQVSDDDDFHMSDDDILANPVASYEAEKKQKQEEEEEDDEDEISIERPMGASASISVERINISASKPSLPKPKPNTKPAGEEPRTDPPVEGSDMWTTMNAALPVALASSPSQNVGPMVGKLPLSEVEEDDGTIKLFWTDYCEMGDRLLLFGKTKHKKSDTYVSCMVQVSGIMRKLYFLPRPHKIDNGIETEEPVTMQDVYSEVSRLFSKDKVEWRSKPCERKYAFDLPDIPHQSSYLMVLYPYTSRQYSPDLKGDTFSHVFGTGTGLFEQFVLMRRVMGPCWLELKDVETKSVANSSWCKVELAVSGPNNITPVPDGDAPQMTLMSVALRTVMNHKDNKQEIVAISARVFDNIQHDTTESPEKLRPYTFTIVRPIGAVFPAGFEAEVKRKGRGTISVERNEQALLSNFLARVQKYDPDVFIGHNLDSVGLNVLLHRIKARNVPNWHRMGRVKRSEWPRSFGRGGASAFFADKQVVAGRLLCDLANDLGKSVMAKCQSWSLTEMCSLVLGVNRYETEEVDTKKLSNWTDTATGLFEYMMHCELDTHFIAGLAIKTQMLPLTRQLTNLAGNSWARTLSGTRSERNEYILLHEFTKNKYVVPDKQQSNHPAHHKKPDLDDDEDHNDDEAVVGSNKKRDKYKGGLVFEPEKGLYDKYVLVMDFNSLYPSIIQEYNICFTTVDRSNCTETDDTVPDPPSSDIPMGILPHLIATLVSRRRQVKSLMKDPKATAVQKAQWDIKQQALKLTANSMYGCLGYTRSRFYARPLAMLTTYKGREILTNTKELAESMDLKVVYGDTDSVMINTNCDGYADAVKIGNEFKKAVNERYRLLEIDIDNVFERLLMHAKKKYAALSCVVDGTGKLETVVEVKGLDMRRREYCALSKEASSFVLDRILSGEQTETVVEKIHEYLRELGDQVRKDAIGFQKFVVYTKLGKDPEQYQGGKTMPQVQVALKRKARGDKVVANDVIAYIIAAGEGSNPADRAYPPQDVTKLGSDLRPDHEYYLAKQVLPPIERLCGAIDGTDVMRLADCLGLDTRKYVLHSGGGGGGGGGGESGPVFDLVPLESTISDADRFQDARRLVLRCPSCGNEFEFEGLLASRQMCTPAGVRCLKCETHLAVFSIVAQVERQIRRHISQYYNGWVVCDDSACGNRTRQISVYGKRCIGKDGLANSCRGIMGYEYSDKTLYNQLLYFGSVFSVDKAKGRGDVEVDALAEHNRASFDIVAGVVAKYLSDCGRRYVDFHNIFGFMQT
ncbi:hypothetical protein POJ06DRAFT_89105 [Lipomyces tetrasporus]|uniref:DNA polymerase n=1 Tax=Lipomyces tetrasporus TaxID=54092 RepID=A0AAD7VTM3_9ASCO|nr:uncharacterized protein POJ06DRAFT_89105 [Lipomyces tetrasporus]KAJ8101126.1 hypothetical protein POJ06DRAFT_89105 [Lipomyces tetrasporus]